MIIFSVIDKEFANVFTTALCLEGVCGKHFLTLFVARDKAFSGKLKKKRILIIFSSLLNLFYIRMINFQ